MMLNSSTLSQDYILPLDQQGQSSSNINKLCGRLSLNLLYLSLILIWLNKQYNT